MKEKLCGRFATRMTVAAMCMTFAQTGALADERVDSIPVKAETREEVKVENIKVGEIRLEGVKSGAQEAPETKKPEAKAEAKEPKEPRGKAIIQVFVNLHSGFGEGKDDRGFELERSYLGYEYNLGKGVSVKGVLDIGKPSAVDDYQRIAYIKNAQISWKYKGMTLSGGLISTTQFNMQEKFWGYRYVMKSFQDLYKMGSSADLGISLAYKFNDWVSADAIVVNGEGYKKIQYKNGFLYGLGATFTPVKGLSLRVYGGLNESADSGKKNSASLATFIGYKAERFTIGAEYNHQWNNGYTEGHDLYGFSVYGNAKLAKWASVLARYDNLFSKDDWNISKDCGSLLLGAEFRVWQYVKRTPNFRMEMPKADGAGNKYSAYLSCYFGI